MVIRNGAERLVDAAVRIKAPFAAPASSETHSRRPTICAARLALRVKSFQILITVRIGTLLLSHHVPFTLVMIERIAQFAIIAWIVEMFSAAVASCGFRHRRFLSLVMPPRSEMTRLTRFLSASDTVHSERYLA